MPPGKDPVEEIVDAALAPGRPLTLMQLEEAVARRALRSPRTLRHRGALKRIVRALHAQPGRYVEIAPGVWIRRDDGPEAGVPARPIPAPLAGGAAAAVAPPQEPSSVEAVAQTWLSAG